VADDGSISNAELGRRLDSLKHDMHDDFNALNARLDKYVRADVLAEQQARQDDRAAALERQIQAARDLQRWLIGGPLIAVVMIIVQVILALRGP
jgi:hypothetical protein